MSELLGGISLHMRIEFLRRELGGLRALSRITGIDAGYLKRLSDGDKTNPSDEVLERLGLRKEIIYVVR